MDFFLNINWFWSFKRPRGPDLAPNPVKEALFKRKKSLLLLLLLLLLLHCLTEIYLHSLVSLVLLQPTRPWSHVICGILFPFGFPLSVLLLPSAWYNNLTSVTNLRHESRKLLARIWPKRPSSQ